MVAHAEHFGATVKSFDDSEARKVKGVVDVRQIPQGVAVYADNTFAALKGRDALKVEWDLSKAETRSAQELAAEYRQTFQHAGTEGGRIPAMSTGLPAEACRRSRPRSYFRFSRMRRWSRSTPSS